MTHTHANYSVIASTALHVTLMDEGPWDQHPTITNDVEWVVAQIAPTLRGRRLFYVDSMDQKDEIIVKDGKFAGFVPGAEPRKVERAPVATCPDCGGEIRERNVAYAHLPITGWEIEKGKPVPTGFDTDVEVEWETDGDHAFTCRVCDWYGNADELRVTVVGEVPSAHIASEEVPQ